MNKIHVKVYINDWRVEDENGCSADSGAQEDLGLLPEVEMDVEYEDLNDVDDLIMDKLYEDNGFYPESFTWIEA